MNFDAFARNAVKEDSIEMIFLTVMFREGIEKTVAAKPCEFSSHYFRYGPFSHRNDFWSGREAVRF